uniref:ATP synthase complex subunit 8 n=1 Tax=Urodus decens TaxID=655053 RepID=A0A076E8S1_9NEOP|nr:ATP synthase F0 subunit 8 [Urodus decens]
MPQMMPINWMISFIFIIIIFITFCIMNYYIFINKNNNNNVNKIYYKNKLINWKW